MGRPNRPRPHQARAGHPLRSRVARSQRDRHWWAPQNRIQHQPARAGEAVITLRSLLTTAAAVALESDLDEERFVAAAQQAFRDANNVPPAAAVAAGLILIKVRDGALGDRFTARDVYQRQWAGLRDPYSVRLGLDLLVERGQLAEYALDTGGRPKVEYVINQARIA